MIRVDVVTVRVPTGEGMALDCPIGPEAYLSPERIDTVTPVGAHHAQLIGAVAGVQSIIRYFDPLKGFRLFLVKQTAKDIARMRRREMRGEDSDSPDFGTDFGT